MLSFGGTACYFHFLYGGMVCADWQLFNVKNVLFGYLEVLIQIVEKCLFHS